MKTIIYLTLFSILICSCKKNDDKKEIIPTINATLSESDTIEGQVDVLITFTNAVSYSVDFGDGVFESGAASAQVTKNHVYSKNGIYTIHISATSETNNIADKDYSIEVTTLPGVLFDVAYGGTSNYIHKICSSYTTYISGMGGGIRAVKGQFGSFLDEQFMAVAYPDWAIAGHDYSSSINDPDISSLDMVSKDYNNLQLGFLSEWTLGGRSQVFIAEKGANYYKGTFSGDVYSTSTINGQHVWANIKNGKFYIKI